MTPPLQALDPRAKQILFDAHWCTKGWVDRQNRATPSPEDLAHAKAHRMMFDPITIGLTTM